jgi:hypothetical protein
MKSLIGHIMGIRSGKKTASLQTRSEEIPGTVGTRKRCEVQHRNEYQRASGTGGKLPKLDVAGSTPVARSNFYASI